MLQLIRSLGRLSISGYLIISGLVVIMTLATYAMVKDHRQIAITQEHQPTPVQTRSDASSVNEETHEDATPQTLGATNTTPAPTLPDTSSPVAKARHLTGSLVFTPANIMLSLSRKLPAVTVSSSDGARITRPEVISSSGGIGLFSQKISSDPSPSWQLQLSGTPLLGVYQVTLHATSTDTDYTGTMTVVVVL